MSPLFQLVYSTAYSLDESLIPTGFIQLFIPMAALIWSHFLFNNWFYSTTVLFNCLFTVQLILFNFYSDGRPYLVALFIQQLVLFNNWFIQLLIPWMSPLFQLVLFNNCFIQLLIPWMSPLFQLVLFNFLFRWPPLFGRTFYSTFYFYST